MEFSKNRLQKQFLFFLSVLLVAGFLVTSLASYFVSRASLRTQIASGELPLTSDNIYTEIQRDLLKPIFISSLMANDTFLRDWVISGEQDVDSITRYLQEIKVKFGAFTSFFVSEKSRIYYHANGILKTVKESEERDIWYFRVREMADEYEINVDPDLANRDAMTIFINHKVSDFDGNYIGATGVGLTINSVTALIERYRSKYERNIFFTDRSGEVVLQGGSQGDLSNIRTMRGISAIADQVLTAPDTVSQYQREGRVVHVNSRFIPELGWYLIVEQSEEGATKNIFNALVVNLFLCLVITAVVVVLVHLTVTAYQKKIEKMSIIDAQLKSANQEQQEEIAEQHKALLTKNAELTEALAEVKQLSGLLPICASCKKIRDDHGYWKQIESYIQAHSEAQFSHSICPECAHVLYPGLLPDEGDNGKNQEE